MPLFFSKATGLGFGREVGKLTGGSSPHDRHKRHVQDGASGVLRRRECSISQNGSVFDPYLHLHSFLARSGSSGRSTGGETHDSPDALVRPVGSLVVALVLGDLVGGVHKASELSPKGQHSASSL